MTASSTRCCGRLDGFAVLAALLLALAWPPATKAEGIEVRRASVNLFEEGYVLEAEFGITLTPALEDALNKGVALYFVLDFELVRPRWYWFNEKLVDLQLQYRLSYNALTRQYRVGVGNLYQNFGTLGEALEFMSRVRRREDLAAGALRKDTAYTAALRLRLDTAQLPRPFQLSALGSRDWNLSSEWHRWTVSP
jgi:hypothetical protein